VSDHRAAFSGLNVAEGWPIRPIRWLRFGNVRGGMVNNAIRVWGTRAGRGTYSSASFLQLILW